MNIDSVPIINFAPSRRGNATEKMAVAQQVAQVCEEIGFFVIVEHGVSKQLVDDNYAVTRAFFDLPDKTKCEVGFNEFGAGYSPFQEESLAASTGAITPADLKESLNIGAIADRNLLPTKPTQGKTLWTAYFDAMSKLASDLMTIFALALDLPEDYFRDKIDHPSSFLRLINYPDQPTDPLPGQLRAGAHSDYGTLTILRAENAPGGLQVLSRQGEWLDVNIVPESFVINIGDLMMRWTNDRWISTVHRVVNPPRDKSLGSRRQSMVFFHNPNNDAAIEPISSCVDYSHPPKYAPITAGEHLEMKTRKAYGK